LSKTFQSPKRKFQPSEISLSQLAYAKKAIELIEKSVKQHGEPPAWAQQNIQKAAQLLGTICAYNASVRKKE